MGELHYIEIDLGPPWPEKGYSWYWNAVNLNEMKLGQRLEAEAAMDEIDKEKT